METKILEKAFKAVANRRRLAILKFVHSQKRITVEKIATAINLSFKATSRHLNKLYNQGYLTRAQKGLYVHYSIAKSPKREIKTILGLILYIPYSNE